MFKTLLVLALLVAPASAVAHNPNHHGHDPACKPPACDDTDDPEKEACKATCKDQGGPDAWQPGVCKCKTPKVKAARPAPAK